MYETHDGLSNQFQVSCAELDFLVEEAKRFKVTGARMIGGGFGGCTLNIIQKNSVDDFIEQSSIAYKIAFGIDLISYRVGIADGSSIVTP